MPKKKKPFIPKGASSKFVLLHRSQQDAEYGLEGASNYVLYPVGKDRVGISDAPPPTAPEEPSEEVAAASLFDKALTSGDHVNSLGFANDGYDYEKHLKSIVGDGVLLNQKGSVVPRTAMVLPAEALPSTKEENKRLLEAITISEACMDEDMQAALNDDEYDGGGELWDDFVVRASEAPLEGSAEAAEGGFDYEKHIATLLARSEGLLGLGEISDEEEDDEGSEYSTEDERGDAVSVSVVGSVAAAERAAIDREFDKALVEYDSDECGSLDDPDDPTLQGFVPLDSEDLSKIMNDFLEDHEKDRTLLGCVPKSKQQQKKEKEEKEEEDGGADEVPSSQEQGAEGSAERGPEAEPDSGTASEDEDDIDNYMLDYFKAREVPKWDCETIVSTYSNLDNHPVRIDEPRRGKPSKKKNQSRPGESDKDSEKEDSGPKRIVISEKSGLPLGALAMGGKKSALDDEDPARGENKGIARSRQETKEEKRARKNAVKEEKQKGRMVKSQTKAAFKEEEAVLLKRAAEGGGVSIFRY